MICFKQLITSTQLYFIEELCFFKSADKIIIKENVEVNISVLFSN